MKLLVSAAEASADVHAARLVEALRARVPDLQVMGIGGRHLENQGLVPVARAADLAVMGSFEILSKLSRIRQAGVDLLAQADKFRPDVAVLVDYPGFHFRVGPRLREMGIPVVYFIPPKVWVWRKGRLNALRQWASQVLCILPFEPAIYQEAGIPAEYVGSPLVEELPLRMAREEARGRLGLPVDAHVMALLPGSRQSEMNRHVPVFLESCLLFARQSGLRWTVLMPIASTLDFDFWSARVQDCLKVLGSPSELDVRVTREGSGEILRAADFGLVKSGTATLEAGVLQCPHVIAYRPGRFTTFAVRHLLRYRGPAGLVNLFRGWKPGDRLIVPEVLHEQVTAENLSRELFELYSSPERLEAMRTDLDSLRSLLMAGSNGTSTPSDRAAAAVLRVAQGRPQEGPA